MIIKTRDCDDMKRTELKNILDNLSKEINAITDEKIKSIQKTLLNLIEVLVDENDKLRAENQKLKDEINHLKGEQGKPNIRKQKQDNDNNHSSDENRKKRENKKQRKPKKKKKKHIKIHRRVTCEVDQNSLPSDAVFKGYENSVLQDIKITPDNVEFKRAIWYSPSLKKSFLAALPEGHYGEFGPGVRSLVITLYRDSGMTEPAIERFFETAGIEISRSTISRMITDGHEHFHQEKEAIIDAGLESTVYQHIDDTGCRVNGKNYYTHILCNPYFTAYFTRQRKDRLTVLGILCRGELKFLLNQETYELMKAFGLSEKRLKELQALSVNGLMVRREMDQVLSQLFPDPKKHFTNRRIILESAGIIYYQRSEYALQYLMCDDAPQFNKIAVHKALCWIHEGRHYKKLHPIVMIYRDAVEAFIEQFWDFYAELLKYKRAPSVELAEQLSNQFDALFSMVTGCDALDERIAKTFVKKETLLLVLRFPFLPLHNNSAELGARVQARMRDINLQTINEKGTEAKDTFATLVQTARKLGVNIYKYVYDRISRKFEMPSLADLIAEKSKMTPDTS